MLKAYRFMDEIRRLVDKYPNGLGDFQEEYDTSPGRENAVEEDEKQSYSSRVEWQSPAIVLHEKHATRPLEIAVIGS